MKKQCRKVLSVFAVCIVLGLFMSSPVLAYQEICLGQEPSIEEMLAFFDQSVDDGTLEGVGRGWIAKLRLNMMRQLLVIAGEFIEQGRTRAAYRLLSRAYDRCDGVANRPWKKDFVTGDAREELAAMIDERLYPVWEGDYEINTIEDLQTLSGYTSVTGNLSVVATSLTSLEGLECLTHVGGDLNIEAYHLTNLDGLNNLKTVGGWLRIIGCDSLTSLEGLNNLKTVGGRLIISDMLLLTSLNGLNNLTSIGGKLNIYFNSILTNLEGLSNLKTIGGILAIMSNDSLTSLEGLNNLTSLGGLEIQINPSLINLQALNNLTSLDDGLYLRTNDALTSLEGLNSLCSVGTYFIIRENPELCTSFAEALRDQVLDCDDIGGDISIQDNKDC